MSKPRSRTQKHQTCNPSATTTSISKRVLAGNDCLVSFSEASQLKAQGIAWCGLAALTFARLGFRIEQSCAELSDVLDELSKAEVIEYKSLTLYVKDITQICADWSLNHDLDVDEIRGLPIFESSLQLVSIEHSRPEPKQFQRLLKKMHQLEKSAVMIITRPPDIVVCFKFSTATSPRPTTRSNSVFVVFDPHPRPSHPHGAGVSFSTSIEQTSRTLSDIVPSLDEGFFESSEQHLSGHLFVSKAQNGDPDVSIVQSSLAWLSLRAQLSVLEGQIKTLTFENQQLRSEVDHLKHRVGQEQVRSKQGPSPAGSYLSAREPSHSSFGTYNHSIDDSSRPSHLVSGKQLPGGTGLFLNDTPPVPAGKVTDSRRQSGSFLGIFTNKPSPGSAKDTNELAHGSGVSPRYDGALALLPKDPLSVSRPSHSANSIHLPGAYDSFDDDSPSVPSSSELGNMTGGSSGKYGGASSIFANNPPPVPAEISSERTSGQDASSTHDGVYTLLSEDSYSGSGPGSSLPINIAPSRLYHVTHRPTPQPGGELSIFSGNPSSPPITNLIVDSDSDSDSEVDEFLEIDDAWVQNALKPRFTCGICLDEQLQENGLQVEDCSHMMCSDCFKDFVCSKIQERRFPVFCPVCMVMDQADGARPSVISRFLVERLEVTEHQLQIWTEMELAEFFVQIHCRQCNRPSFVDRPDYMQATKVLCPQVDCTNVWCKNCDQTITSGGPKHSCDGSSELDHLIQLMSWKRCPNCKTPVQRIDGCNSMSCIVPGCNASFCYRCGRANHAC